MSAMGVQLEPINQSLEQYGPWHFHDIRFQQDQRVPLEAALLQTAAIPALNDRLREISRGSLMDCHSPPRAIVEVTLSVSKTPKPTSHPPGWDPTSTGPGPVPALNNTSRSLFPTAVHPALVFTLITPSGKDVVTFPLQERPAPPKPSRCLKRRRPATDVDGPNTASLGCKKRRLLRHLVTSRLSQPFSLPATHIPNREAVATGDKRFKLAAIMSARRLSSAVATAHAHAPPPQQPPQPNPSTWLRRAAVLNCLRTRVCAEAAERGSVPFPDVAAKAAAAVLFQQGHATTGHVVGAGNLVDSTTRLPHPPTPPTGAGTPPPSPTPTPYLHRPSPTSPPPSTTAATLPPSSPASSSASSSILHPPPNHVLPSAAAAATTTTTTARLRIPSPRLRPLRSPELRVTRPPPLELVVEEEDDMAELDDGVAFPTSEHESRYFEDDDEEEEEDEEEGADGGGRRGRPGVYADFSVIFGGGGGGGGGGGERGESDEEGGGGGGDHFEDYMDDLDGIPWNARC